MLPYGVNENILLTNETEIIKIIPSTTNQLPSSSSSSAAAEAVSSSSSTVSNQIHDHNLNHKVIKDDNNNNHHHLISEENKVKIVKNIDGNDNNTIIDYKSTSPVLRSSMKNFSDISNNNITNDHNNKQIKDKEVTFDMNPMIRDISRASDQTNYSFNNSENTSLSSLTIDKYSFHLTTEEKQKYLTMIQNNNNNKTDDDDQLKRKTKKNSSSSVKKTNDCCCCSCIIV